MLTSQTLYQILTQLTSQRKFLIAYSGGLDSHVLLHCMAEIRKEYPDIQLQAVHVHHNLSPHADVWAKHCQEVCQHLAIKFILKKINVKHKTKKSLEATARTLRYQAFREILTANTCLLTAHTENDQAETLLLQLFRGAGTKGLAAMPENTAFANNILLRPLLKFSRSELHQYAREQQLHWIEDESNLNLKFSRNFIRHKILPIMQQHWPNVVTTISRSAKHCAEADNLLAELAVLDMEKVKGTIKNTLSISALLQLNSMRQRNVLRHWLQSLNFSLPSEIKLLQIQKEIMLARKDAKPVVQWDEVTIRRYQDNLYSISPLISPSITWKKIWNIKQPLLLPNDQGSLIAEKVMAPGLLISKITNVEVRYRQGGEQCRPAGRIGRHSLKKLFQEWQIPSWERDQIPLLFVEDKLIAVVGHCICEGFVTQINENGWAIKIDNVSSRASVPSKTQDAEGSRDSSIR